ncbi:hypothetical protein AK812_SmicGene44587 [Symbiodinium microadriaticum]|uniref:Uncharacterized protein n=1 Tax=Symbiodinium microadriaticum TaxID=2951 RepID=A0A1Q9BY32_SYMMI|nr:hypothetical protein AK812_SmicGene44587 [Symbiodinium microadriaticum]
MRRFAVAFLAPILLFMFRLARRWRRRAQRSLQQWVITEYRWPRKMDHVCPDAALPAAECSDQTEPAHTALVDNLQFIQTLGASIAEGVNGYHASRWAQQTLGLAHHRFTLVAWGSPHMELSDGSYSQQKTGRAACEKACVFQSLCKQFQHSFVLILFAGHDVDPVPARRGDAVMVIPALLEPVARPRQYYPGHSKGSLRAHGLAPVQAVLRVPLTWTATVPWTSCIQASSQPDKDGSVGQLLNVYKLVSPRQRLDVSFLDASRLCAGAELTPRAGEHHVMSFVISH